MKEEIALVDLDDQITGYCEKMAVHRNGLLHRAFSLFIFNEKGEMLIQKRSRNKYHSGGLWTNACCSHQRKNEELSDAVHRRLREELGFDCALTEAFSFVYRTVFANGLTEYELDHVFTGTYSGPVELNKEEASDSMWISPEKLKAALLAEPQKFTAWFLIAAPGVLKGREK